MDKNSSDGYRIACWRLVGEYAHSPGRSGNQTILARLMAAVQTMDMLPSDLERIRLAASRAVARAECDAVQRQARPSLVVRVFVSATAEDTITPRNWGFFVLERPAAEMDASVAGADRIDDRASTHLIELYVYAQGIRA